MTPPRSTVTVAAGAPLPVTTTGPGDVDASTVAPSTGEVMEGGFNAPSVSVTVSAPERTKTVS
ncbi:hypothetical protein LQ955_02220 [Subtercola endophyticus]|nr:hypothetical protein LQ955_02220 [Subtercola endophyticus]